MRTDFDDIIREVLAQGTGENEPVLTPEYQKMYRRQHRPSSPENSQGDVNIFQPQTDEQISPRYRRFR